MIVATAAPERFDLGRVFSGGFAIVGRRPLTFIILAAVFCYLPTAATLWLTTDWLPQPTPGAVDLPGTFRRLGIVELIAVAFGGFGWVMQGAAAAAALSDFGERPLSVGEALGRAAGDQLVQERQGPRLAELAVPTGRLLARDARPQPGRLHAGDQGSRAGGVAAAKEPPIVAHRIAGAMLACDTSPRQRGEVR